MWEHLSWSVEGPSLCSLHNLHEEDWLDHTRVYPQMYAFAVTEAGQGEWQLAAGLNSTPWLPAAFPTGRRVFWRMPLKEKRIVCPEAVGNNVLERVFKLGRITSCKGFQNRKTKPCYSLAMKYYSAIRRKIPLIETMWVNLKNIKSSQWMSPSMVPSMVNSRKWKLICSDSKQISGFLEQMGNKKHSGLMKIFHIMSIEGGYTGVYICQKP